MSSGATMYERTLKRAVDVAVASMLLALTSPIQLACATWVRMDDGGPAFYVQSRAGRKGQPIRVLKFRTMRVGTDRTDGGFPGERAVTRPGRLLRRTSIDELPQLWNVVRGDMSLVGPRPAPLSHVERYAPGQARRLQVRPGLTGAAQVKYRNSAPWSVRIEEDLRYVDNVSFIKDVKILLATLPAVLGGRGQVVGQLPSEVDDLGQARA